MLRFLAAAGLVVAAIPSLRAESILVVAPPATILPAHAGLGCADLLRAWDGAELAADVSVARVSLMLRAEELGCCDLAPRLAHEIAAGVSWPVTMAARDALSRMDCRGGNEELAVALRAALGCEPTETDAEWLAVAAGMVAGPEELSILRGEWARTRPSDCGGYAVVEAEDLAAALTFAGDDSALQWLLALHDADMLMGWLDDGSVVARAVCRLPATTRVHEVPRLVGHMQDQDQADELILGCVDLGCWLADELAEPALRRRDELEEARVEEEMVSDTDAAEPDVESR